MDVWCGTGEEGCGGGWWWWAAVVVIVVRMLVRVNVKTQGRFAQRNGENTYRVCTTFLLLLFLLAPKFSESPPIVLQSPPCLFEGVSVPTVFCYCYRRRGSTVLNFRSPNGCVVFGWDGPIFFYWGGHGSNVFLFFSRT